MDENKSLEDFIGHLQALNRHLRSSAFDQGKHPITRVQWLLLRCLYRQGGTTIGQLAEHLDVRASTMSQMIDRLEKSGYVRRSGDPRDARVKLIQLSEHGQQLIRNMEATWIKSLALPFEQLTPDEKQQLVSMMHKLVDLLPKRSEG